MINISIYILYLLYANYIGHSINIKINKAVILLYIYLNIIKSL